MDLNIQIVQINDFIRTMPIGELDLDSSKQFINGIAGYVAAEEGRPLLVDLRQTSSVLKNFDVFELASSLLQYGKAFRRKTALLTRSDDSFDRARFFELVAYNRGYRVNAFTSFEDAVMWLAGDTTQHGVN